MIFAEVALFPKIASTTAQRVDTLFLFMVCVTGAVGLLVAFLLIFFCIRYRRRPGETGNPPETKPPGWIEWAWTLTPLAIFMFMFVWGAEVYFGAYRPPDDAATVYCIGKQWMWKFQHPEGQREINELHVPLGKPIRILLTSEDVIHSLFVPDFRIHMDVLPERYTSVWFQPTGVGRHRLFCSQYCGTQHAGMVGEVVVMEPGDYERWLRLGAEGSLALQGRKTFLKYRCLACHSADENARAPVLENLYGKAVPLSDGRVVTADENYIRESIYYPSAKIVAGYENIMPAYKGQVTEDEMIELIAYIKSLAPGQTPRRVESYPPPTGTPPINPQEETPSPKNQGPKKL
jgi:cytochrome c oxidase subunit II